MFENPIPIQINKLIKIHGRTHPLCGYSDYLSAAALTEAESNGLRLQIAIFTTPGMHHPTLIGIRKLVINPNTGARDPKFLRANWVISYATPDSKIRTGIVARQDQDTFLYRPPISISQSRQLFAHSLFTAGEKNSLLSIPVPPNTSLTESSQQYLRYHFGLSQNADLNTHLNNLLTQY